MGDNAEDVFCALAENTMINVRTAVVIKDFIFIIFLNLVPGAWLLIFFYCKIRYTSLGLRDSKMSKTDNYISKSIVVLMPIINASSIMVTVLMGKLKTAPRQAHFLFLLLSMLCNTPIMLTDITISVTKFVKTG